MTLYEWTKLNRGGRQLIADELGVTLMTIHNLASGKYKPSLSQIIKINKITGLTVGELDFALAEEIKLVNELGIL